MPRSRKRHHSRSRSKTRSRSHSPDRGYDKSKKPSSNEKDGKRRRLDEVIDSPQPKRSLSFNDDAIVEQEDVQEPVTVSNNEAEGSTSDQTVMEVDVSSPKRTQENLKESKSENEEIVISDSDSVHIGVVYDKRELLATPKKCLTPKQLQKKVESEKKKQQKLKEKVEREKQKQEEKAKIIAEKQKLKEQKEAERQKLLQEKQKQLELKQKEKEQKEEQKKKEREEKEQKRKEKEELEAQKRQEKLKKIQEIEEKNKEKQKEAEKKQKTAALFVNFFKKTELEEKESKTEKTNNSNFMPFEVKSDMKLPPLRRAPLTSDQINELDFVLQNQNENTSYLQELKTGKITAGKSTKTWPYEDLEDEVTIVEADKVLGETICEGTTIIHKMKAKFLHFHENRRPAYFGTWRKKSKFIKPRRPFDEDTGYFNYEEDSDDDWEEEEQGESLEMSGDEEEKDTENDEDDYEVDNEFFVPHGHLSDDEVDDEENARLSPESLKQKLKLLKDEFEEDIKSKTRKLKPRSIGGVWINKQGDNIDDAIYRYLLPFAMIVDGPKTILKRSEIFSSPAEKKKVKLLVELPNEHIPYFLKIIHGNVNKKKTIIEEFLAYMTSIGHNVDVSKANLTRFLKKSAQFKRGSANGPMKNKFGWFVNDDIRDKYNIKLDVL